MDAFTDFVVGHGELWSAILFAATLRQLGGDAGFMDTRELLVVTPTSDGNNVDLDYGVSQVRLDAWGRRHGVNQVCSSMMRIRQGMPCMCSLVVWSSSMQTRSV